ncbi:response regulator [Thalassoglobus sp. JC818]|uniref:response regulator n=1 Tax=Thalassoglobus sp. JC818 TaxID=3232136 RepID=UPI003457A9CC
MENRSILDASRGDVAILRSRYDTFLQRIVSLALTTHDFDSFEADVLRRLDVEFGGVAAAVWESDQETGKWKLIQKSPSWNVLAPNLAAVQASPKEFQRSVENSIPGRPSSQLFAISNQGFQATGLLSGHNQQSAIYPDDLKTQLVILDSSENDDHSIREALQRFADSFSLARLIVAQRAACHFNSRVHSALIVTSPVPVVTCSPDGTVLDCNRAAERVFGVKNVDIHGRHVAEIGCDDFREMARLCSENRLPVYRRVNGNSPDGARWSMDATLCPVLSLSEEVLSVTLIANDRSSLDLSLQGQKCQEEICSILAESGNLLDCWSEVLRCLCSSLQFDEGSVWSTGAVDGALECVTRWNRHFDEMGGSATLRPLDDFSNAVGQAIKRKNIVWTDQSLMISKREKIESSDVRLAFASEVAVPIVHDEKVHFILILRGNLSARKRELVAGICKVISDVARCVLARDLNAVAAQANKESQRQSAKMQALGLIAGEIAHDFNNLLTVMMGNCDLVRSLLPQDSAERAMIGEVSEAVDRAGVLTKRILSFSRKCGSDPKVIHASEQIRRLSGMLQMIAGKQVELNANLEDYVYPILLDPVEFEQILINLTANARDAMEGKGRISISTSNVRLSPRDVRDHKGAYPGEYLLIQFEDNGCGMDARTKSQVFEPFFTTKKEEQGTGIGLMTVQGIVNRARGLIRLESEVGSGTRFSIYLPRQSDGIAPSSLQKNDAPTRECTERILVVEDDSVLRRLLTRILEVHGFRVEAFAEGREALLEYQKSPEEFDLVLSDIMMPGISGFEVAHRVRSIVPDVPVILMTGFGEILESAEAAEVNVPILTKPFTSASLLQTIFTTLDGEPDAFNPTAESDLEVDQSSDQPEVIGL